MKCKTGDSVSDQFGNNYIGRARALVDYQPSPYDTDALKFKVQSEL